MLKQKMRAKFSRGVDLRPYATLKMGEKGTVVNYERDGLGVFSVDIKLDEHHPGLNGWQNVAHITGPELESVEFSKQWEFRRVNVSKVAILAFGVIALLLGVAVTEALEARTVRGAIFERPLCGRYDCLQQQHVLDPGGHIRGRVNGYYDITEGVT